MVLPMCNLFTYNVSCTWNIVHVHGRSAAYSKRGTEWEFEGLNPLYFPLIRQNILFLQTFFCKFEIFRCLHSQMYHIFRILPSRTTAFYLLVNVRFSIAYWNCLHGFSPVIWDILGASTRKDKHPKRWNKGFKNWVDSFFQRSRINSFGIRVFLL